VSLVDRVREVLPPRYREFAKFLVVGGTSWIIDAGLFTLLNHTVLDNKVLTSKIISILVATIFSYVANREWSFRHRGGRELHHEALLFFLVNGLALIINLIPLWFMHYVVGINTNNGYSQFAESASDWIAANVVGTIIAMAFRYWCYRRFVFPDELHQVETAMSGQDEPGGSTTDSARIG
jgi:putative flippase GtrA